MPGRIFANLRFMSTSGGSGNPDATPIEVTPENGLPVAIVAPPANPVMPFFNSALSNTAVPVMGPNGRDVSVVLIEASNIAAADAFIQMFNAAAAPTLGTTVPTYSFLVPKGDATNRGAMDKMFPVPIEFPLGLFIAATTTSTGSSAPATALVVNLAVR